MLKTNMGGIMSLYFQLRIWFLILLAQTAHVKAHISSHFVIHNHSALLVVRSISLASVSKSRHGEYTISTH
jgi:hypothetical protein